MKNPKSPIYNRNRDRRSGVNRRWIKSYYSGEERRSGEDRRDGPSMKNLPVVEDLDVKKIVGFEKLLVSNTIQLDAVTRILIEKGIVKEQELLEMMKKVQAEYRNKDKK